MCISSIEINLQPNVNFTGYGVLKLSNGATEYKFGMNVLTIIVYPECEYFAVYNFDCVLR